MPSPVLPNQNQPFIGPDGRVNEIWYRYLAGLNNQVNPGPGPINIISTALGIIDFSGPGGGQVAAAGKTAAEAYELAVLKPSNGNGKVAENAYALAQVALSRRGPFIDGGQLPATATSDNAVAGALGEYNSASVASGSAVGLTNNVAADVTNFSLSPGDWNVWINGYFTGAGTTTVSNLNTYISLVSATVDNTLGRVGRFASTGATLFANGDMSLDAGIARLSLATTTTVYLVVQAGFAVSTCSAYGIIQARRAR